MLQHRDEVGAQILDMLRVLHRGGRAVGRWRASSARSRSPANFRAKLLTWGSCQSASNSCWKSDDPSGASRLFKMRTPVGKSSTKSTLHLPSLDNTIVAIFLVFTRLY